MVEVSGYVEAAIGMSPRIFSVAVGIASEAGGEQFGGLVGAHGDLARQGQPARGNIVRRVVAVLPLGVEANYVPLEMIQRQAHRAQGSGADGNTVLDELRVIDRPLDHLHAADGAADDEFDPLDSQELQQMALRPNDIGDRNQRKIPAVGPSGFGIDGRGSG